MTIGAKVRDGALRMISFRRHSIQRAAAARRTHVKTSVLAPFTLLIGSGTLLIGRHSIQRAAAARWMEENSTKSPVSVLYRVQMISLFTLNPHGHLAFLALSDTKLKAIEMRRR